MALPGLPGNVLIVGPSCAGKSTLADTLSERLGLRVVELDGLAFDPGWVRVSAEEFEERVAEATDEEGWIAPGNYYAIRHVLWPRAGTAIWLDFSYGTVIPRMARRTWRRWRSKELLWGNNRENFWAHFLPNDRSLLWFTIRTLRNRRKRLEGAMADPEWQHLSWMRFRSTRELERWVESLPAPREPVR